MKTQHTVSNHRHLAWHKALLAPACLALAIGCEGALAGALTDLPKIIGAWKVTVQPVDCVSGQNSADPFIVLSSYYADGNTLEIPIAGFSGRTASHGTWRKVGWRKFASRSVYGRTDVNGLPVGYGVIERMISVAKDGQSADIRARGIFLTTDEQEQFSVCVTATGERLPEPAVF